MDEDVAAPLELLQNESLAAEKAGAEALRELDVDINLSGGAEKGIALAQHRAVLEGEMDDFSGERAAERHPRRRDVRLEEGQKQALAREKFPFQAAEQAALHARVHRDAVGHERHRARLGANLVARPERHNDRLHVVADNFMGDHGRRLYTRTRRTDG